MNSSLEEQREINLEISSMLTNLETNLRLTHPRKMPTFTEQAVKPKQQNNTDPQDPDFKGVLAQMLETREGRVVKMVFPYMMKNAIAEMVFVMMPIYNDM